MNHRAQTRSILLAAAIGCATIRAEAETLTPSNHQDAFSRLSLYANRNATGVTDHVSHPEWPSFLVDPSLLILEETGPDEYDSVAVINSQPYDGVGYDETSTALYTLSPPQHITSVGVVLMGGLLFDGVDEFNDPGKPLMHISSTFENGDTVGLVITAGVIRNWISGGACGSPFLVAAPSGIELYSGPGQGTGFDVHYDFMVVQLPGSHRRHKVRSIRFTGLHIPHDCGPEGAADGTSAIFSLTVWPRFVIVNRNSQALTLQRQGDPQWRNNPYGGFFDGPTLIGAAKTIWSNGCFLACVSMAHNYYGISSTPATLNLWLQNNNGYPPQRYARLNNVEGQDIGDEVPFDKLGSNVTLSNGRTIVVERPIGTPLVTLEILSNSPGLARISARHRATAIDSGDVAYFHSYPLHDKASRIYSNNTWELRALPRSDIACEAALAESLPVMLNVREGEHWVLADGRAAHFVSGTAARGTYTIKDPGIGAVQLFEHPYGNVYGTNMHVCRRRSSIAPVPGHEAREAMHGLNETGMTIMLDGPVVGDLVDPLGRSITYDPEADAYSTTHPDAIATRNWIVDDDLDPAEISGGVDVFEVPGAVDGEYVLRLRSNGIGKYCVTANAHTATVTAASTGYSGTAPTSGFEYYSVSYSSAGSIAIQPMAPTSVGAEDSAVPSLSVMPNPTARVVRIAYLGLGRQAGRLAIYDLQGREVVTLMSGSLKDGSQVVEWLGNDSAGRSVPAGVYFVRFETDGHAVVRRVVMTR